MSFTSQFVKFCNFYNKNRNVLAKNKSYCIGNRKSANMHLSSKPPAYPQSLLWRFTTLSIYMGSPQGSTLHSLSPILLSILSVSLLHTSQCCCPSIGFKKPRPILPNDCTKSISKLF